MPSQPKSPNSKKIETLKHSDDKRKHIPTAEFQSVMAEKEKSPVRVAYELVAVAKRLSVYEKDQQMDAEEFFDQYDRGKLSDDGVFIDWALEISEAVVIANEQLAWLDYL